ncbi:septum formation initiator family protein [Arthrobacter sp. NPDC058130]|uniref:FtsB family cell division protein n=1 Tax=Arthrobacter sp. NPDC058130 TaxID=3346353 RepID=UPI0036E97D34
MATRRPNVPRATPAARRPAAAGSGETDDGGEVIQADFGGSRSGKPTPATSAGTAPSSGTASPSGTASSSARASSPAAGKPGTNGTGPAAGQRKPAQKSGANPGTKPATTPGTRPAAGKATGKAGGKATGRAAAADSAESLDPVPAKAFSGRLLALGVVMIAITILLAPTVKIFLDKRAEIAALQADIAAKQTKQEDLKRQVSRWQDPNYVKQQARDRINMVMPGETGYWVFGSDLPAAQSSGTAGAASAQDPANLPWVDALWESIRRSATD